MKLQKKIHILWNQYANQCNELSLQYGKFSECYKSLVESINDYRNLMQKIEKQYNSNNP